MTIRICVEVSANEYVAELARSGGEAGESVRVLLNPLRLAAELSDLAMLLTVTSGFMTSALREHLENHFTKGALPSGGCAFCKLQGKILAGQGRKRLSESDEQRRKVPPVTTLREGATYQGEVDSAKAREARETERLRRLPKLGKGGAISDPTGLF